MTSFDALYQQIVNEAGTVQVKETAVDRYYLGEYETDTAVYLVEYWDGLAVTIGRVGCGESMTRLHECPPWNSEP